MNNRILPLVALMIAVGMFFIYVNPTWTGAIATTNTAIAADDQALAFAKQYSQQQNQLAAARDAITPANLATLTTFLPGSIDNVGLILDLNALAARSGLSITNIDVVMNTNGQTSGQQNAGVSPSAATNPVGSIELSLSASGTFASLQTFLLGVEKSARLLDVHDLVVKSSDTGVYTYQMSVRLYWLR